MPSRSKQSGTSDAKPAPPKKRRDARSKGTSAGSSRHGKGKIQTKSRVQGPDPDLPTVEKALLEFARDAGKLSENAGGPGLPFLNRIVDMLTDALAKDISECRRCAFLGEHPVAQNRELSMKSRGKRKRSSDEDAPERATKRPKDCGSGTDSTVSDPGLGELRASGNGMQASPLVVRRREQTSEQLKKIRMQSPQKRTRVLHVSLRDQLPPMRTRTAERKGKSGTPGNSRAGRTKKKEVRTANASQRSPIGTAKNSRRIDTEVEEVVEEEITLNEGVGDLASSEDEVDAIKKTKEIRRSSGIFSLPWWRAIDSRMSLPARHVSDEDVLRGYMLALMRSCVRESWKAETLRESYERDPSSSRGTAFLSVSSSLLMMERARHMGQCRMKWRPELIQELLERRGFEWSNIQRDPSFRQFVGCDVCLGHRLATKRLKLHGMRYDSRNFWPTNSNVDILSAKEEERGALSVTVELSAESRPGHLTAGDDQGESEYWVDAQCLRKCLVFHELVHASAILAEDVRYMIEDVLRDGIVDIPSPGKLRDQKSMSVLEWLERHLVQMLSQNRDFLKRRVAHFVDIVQLGNIYFSAGDAEVLDSGGGTRDSMVASKIYDAPIELNDDKYRVRLRKLESLTEKKLSGESFAALAEKLD